MMCISWVRARPGVLGIQASNSWEVCQATPDFGDALAVSRSYQFNIPEVFIRYDRERRYAQSADSRPGADVLREGCDVTEPPLRLTAGLRRRLIIFNLIMNGVG